MSESISGEIAESYTLVPTEEPASSTKRYLTFLSNDLTFGISTEYVSEIIINYKIRPVPMVPEYIRGIINLRGQVIPIIDLRLFVGKPAKDNMEENCIIILTFDSCVLGIIVDSVSQVLDINFAESSPIPTASQNRLADRMITLPDQQVVLLFNSNSILI